MTKHDINSPDIALFTGFTILKASYEQGDLQAVREDILTLKSTTGGVIKIVITDPLDVYFLMKKK